MKNIFPSVLLGVLCAAPAVAVACSCAPPPAPKVALEQSAAVFVGRVAASEKLSTGNPMASNNKYQFAVSKKWKGVEGDTISVVSSGSSAACGINFDSDRDYLVYTYKNKGDDQMYTNLCTRTKRVADADADLAELGEPLKTDELTVKAPNGKPTDVAKYYRVAANGDIQVDVNAPNDSLVALAKAVESKGFDQRFRLNWTAPTNPTFFGTALYNRQNSTLKAYSRSENGSQISVSSVLYSGVTDEIVQKLASTDKIEDFFRTYANYGVTKKDLGSKMIVVSG